MPLMKTKLTSEYDNMHIPTVFAKPPISCMRNGKAQKGTWQKSQDDICNHSSRGFSENFSSCQYTHVVTAHILCPPAHASSRNTHHNPRRWQRSPSLSSSVCRSIQVSPGGITCGIWNCYKPSIGWSFLGSAAKCVLAWQRSSEPIWGGRTSPMRVFGGLAIHARCRTQQLRRTGHACLRWKDEVPAMAPTPDADKPRLLYLGREV
ncbi:hypothetical protein LZ30DRAFT_345586 [Colletotrichum cereale]|nr:hypothetical protein LZ30DRAFT_345586 [Colletotrichum cereale]